MAKGAEVEAVGLARAKAYREQVQALGQGPTALVNAINALAEKNVKIMPDILVAGGGGGSVDGLAGTLMRYFAKGGGGAAGGSGAPETVVTGAPAAETPMAGEGPQAAG
jgi:hypothetical protein